MERERFYRDSSRYYSVSRIFVNTLLKIVSGGKYSGGTICFDRIKNIYRNIMKTKKERWKTRENERKINGVGESGHA